MSDFSKNKNKNNKKVEAMLDECEQKQEAQKSHHGGHVYTLTPLPVCSGSVVQGGGPDRTGELSACCTGSGGAGDIIIGHHRGAHRFQGPVGGVLPACATGSHRETNMVLIRPNAHAAFTTSQEVDTSHLFSAEQREQGCANPGADHVIKAVFHRNSRCSGSEDDWIYFSFSYMEVFCWRFGTLTGAE